MRPLLVVLIAALGLDLGASLAAASCRQQSLAENAERAEVVAFGTVSGNSFEIRQVLKGQAGGTVQVRFGETSGAVTSVDYMATNGDHTLYLRRDGAGYATNACSGSHQGAPTPEERAFFAAGPVPTSAGGTETSGGVATSGESYDAGPVVAYAPVGLAIALIAAGVVAFVLIRTRRSATS